MWSKKKPKNAASGIVFPGVQTSTWDYDEIAREYYFHWFYKFQPDMNTSNPEVQAEILKIMGFWLQLGVSGFRMDAVPFVISQKGAEISKPVEQYDMLRTFSQFLNWRKGDAVILGEANVLPGTDMKYFGGSGERMQMMFNFQVNQHLFYAMASGDARPLVSAMKATKNRPATAQWGQFLRNHDELDLGRLLPKQRQCVFDAFGPEKNQTLRLNRTSTTATPADSLEMIDGSVAVYHGRIISSDIRVDERKCRSVSIRCFEGEIRQVLNNLIGNSIDAMPAGGRLILRSREAVDWRTGSKGLRMTVADTGPGISEETKRKIFDPFFTTKGMSGTGLGLWISHEIVARHQGALRARSSQRTGSAGTVFTVFLPFDLSSPTATPPPCPSTQPAG